MTHCEFLIGKGIFHGFKITGHVGFDVKGKDVVCAAISAVSQSTLIGLNEVMKVDLNYEIKDGLIRCDLKDSNECAQFMMKTLYQTLVQISKQYPRNVSISEVEV
jgi:uncharacterized protein YsxB (DUF464 family)